MYKVIFDANVRNTDFAASKLFADLTLAEDVAMANIRRSIKRGGLFARGNATIVCIEKNEVVATITNGLLDSPTLRDRKFSLYNISFLGAMRERFQNRLTQG